MKKIVSILFILILIVSFAVPVYAAEGTVTYDGNAKEFIFKPGSEYSPTDLFSEFQGVMPGDTLTQKITVKNDASNKVKVKIYLRSLGAHEDSVDFLSQLSLRVKKSADNEMAYMFDAAANETAQLTDWVCLGTLYSGGEVNLDVLLDVPTELENQYSSQIGYLDWEFMIEEFPIEDSDPKVPQTGDNSFAAMWITAGLCSVAVAIVLIAKRKKNIH